MHTISDDEQPLPALSSSSTAALGLGEKTAVPEALVIGKAAKGAADKDLVGEELGARLNISLSGYFGPHSPIANLRSHDNGSIWTSNRHPSEIVTVLLEINGACVRVCVCACVYVCVLL